MANWQERWNSTTKAHDDIVACAQVVEDVVRRLDDVFMEKLADRLASIPHRLVAASETIRGNAAEEVSERLLESDKFMADAMLALLDKARDS